MAWACSYVQGPPPRTRVLVDLFLQVPQAHRPTTAPKARAAPSCPGPHLCALTLVDEEDAGERVREAAAVSGKEAASLVHVGPELEYLLLCGEGQAEARGCPPVPSRGGAGHQGPHSLV